MLNDRDPAALSKAERVLAPLHNHCRFEPGPPLDVVLRLEYLCKQVPIERDQERLVRLLGQAGVSLGDTTITRDETGLACCVDILRR